MAPLPHRCWHIRIRDEGAGLRKRFQKVVSELIGDNENLVLLLGDIGVFGFRGSMAEHPSRVLNIGILEQAMTSFAAGLAMGGRIPVLHSIAPFLIERPYEQLKVDFGYQGLAGKFISVGGSFDYAGLGATHHSPGDVSALLAIPGFEIFCPGTADELEFLLRKNLLRESLSYFRLSEYEFVDSRVKIELASPQIISQHSDNVLIAFGPSMKEGSAVATDLDLSLIYVNEITVDSSRRLSDLLASSEFRNIILLQPFYQGTTSHLFQSGLNGKRVLDIGVPREFIHEYGTIEEIKKSLGLTVQAISGRILEFVNEK